MIFTVFGILSAIVFVVGIVPYLKDTLQGKTKPHRVTWGVACLMNSVTFANQLASGASDSLWIFAVAALATGTIFLASLSNGTGGHSKLDIFAIVTAFAGVGLWMAFDSPTLSVLSVLVMVFVSLLPTFAKAKKHPESETRVFWLTSFICSILVILSVGELNWVLLIVPTNNAILQAYLIYLLYFRAKHHRQTSMRVAAEPIEP